MNQIIINYHRAILYTHLHTYIRTRIHKHTYLTMDSQLEQLLNDAENAQRSRIVKINNRASHARTDTPVAQRRVSIKYPADTRSHANASSHPQRVHVRHVNFTSQTESYIDEQIAIDPRNINYMNVFKISRESILKVVKSVALAIRLIPPYRQDAEIVEAAVKFSPKSYLFVRGDLRNAYLENIAIELDPSMLANLQNEAASYAEQVQQVQQIEQVQQKREQFEQNHEQVQQNRVYQDAYVYEHMCENTHANIHADTWRIHTPKRQIIYEPSEPSAPRKRTRNSFETDANNHARDSKYEYVESCRKRLQYAPRLRATSLVNEVKYLLEHCTRTHPLG